MKICTKCQIDKDEEEFRQRVKKGEKLFLKNGKKALISWCKDCEAISVKIYQNENSDKVKKWNKNWRIRNPEKSKESRKKANKNWKIKNPDYDKNRYESEDYKEKRNVRLKIKRKVNIIFKLRQIVSGRVNGMLKSKNSSKRKSSILKYLPYTIEQLKQHIESLWESWMNWGNHGKYEEGKKKWHIDHITPQSLLSYDSMDHPNFQKCWALSNLRPLEAMENMKKHNSIFGKITNCLVCGSNKLTEIINLGANSFADTFVKKENLERGLEIYLLSCNLCEECDNIQISLKTDPKKRYSSQWNEYSYTMSNSRISRDHWSEFAKSVLGKNKIDFNDLIVEIGSNDGFLLEQFNVSGYKNTLGIDPSEEMGNLAEKRGIKIVKQLFQFFDLKSQIIQKASIVVSNNTVNHSEDPVVFINSVNNIMKDDGIFVFETPWWFEGFKTYKFDCIYLEHQTYFTVKFCKNILEKCHMYIDDIEVVEYHGGSLRIFAKKRKNRENHCNKISDLIKLEEESGLFEVESYKKYMNFIKAQRNKFLQKIFDIKSNGGNIVGIGACAKGNTFLNFYRLDNTIVDYVTDSSPQKQGKFTPLSFIPIVSDDVLKQYKEVYCIILSWNLSNELKQNLSKINPNIIFIAPGVS